MNQQIVSKLNKFSKKKLLGRNLDNVISQYSKNVIGLQIAVNHNAKTYLKKSYGFTDARCTRYVTDNTLFLTYSVVKGITGILLHKLQEERIIDLKIPIYKYWPEFYSEATKDITLEHILTHTSGLHAMPLTLDLTNTIFTETWADTYFKNMEKYIIGMKLDFKPGSQSAYSAILYGFIIKKVIECATNMHFNDVFNQYLVDRLGLNGKVYIGLPTKARNFSINTHDFDTVETVAPTYFWKMLPLLKNQSIPSVNGYSTAEAVAKIFSVVACEGKYLNMDSLDNLCKIRTEQYDAVVGQKIKKSAGLMVDLYPDTVGHGGINGNIAFAHREKKLSVAVLVNTLKVDHQMVNELCDTIINHFE